MKKAIWLVMALCAPVMAEQVSVLDELKSTPLTSYEAGRNQLATLAAAVNLYGKFNGKDDFRIELLEDESNLGIEVSATLPVRKVTQDECNTIFIALNKTNVISDIPALIWPGLSPEQVDTIKDELFIQAKLIAEENNEFATTCRKTLAEI